MIIADGARIEVQGCLPRCRLSRRIPAERAGARPHLAGSTPLARVHAQEQEVKGSNTAVCRANAGQP